MLLLLLLHALSLSLSRPNNGGIMREEEEEERDERENEPASQPGMIDIILFTACKSCALKTEKVRLTDYSYGTVLPDNIFPQCLLHFPKRRSFQRHFRRTKEYDGRPNVDRESISIPIIFFFFLFRLLRFFSQ